MTQEQIENVNRMAKQLAATGWAMQQAAKKMTDAVAQVGLTLQAGHERMQQTEESEQDG